jgi:hypothetical protein
MTQKLIFLFSERRFIQPAEPLLQVRRRKIWLYLGCQIIGVALPVAISQTIAAIGVLQPFILQFTPIHVNLTIPL